MRMHAIISIVNDAVIGFRACLTAADDQRLSDREARIGVLVFIALFFFAALPALTSVSKHHSDERFYTDAALQMLETGDYLTPRYADGRPRFHKPILSYWLIAGAYRLMGVGMLPSRLPFLMAGCLLIWVVWHLCRVIFGPGRGALTAAWIMGANIVTVEMSSRSTPDILLCLFLAVCLYGFARIIFRSQNDHFSYACAYFGAAAALETKGLLGLLPLGYVGLFCWLHRDTRSRFKALFHWPLILGALLAGTFWFGAMLALHGQGALAGFLGDQVGDKLAAPGWMNLSHLAAYVLVPLRHFLPWSLLLMVILGLGRRAVFRHVSKNSGQWLFVLGWFLLLVVVFSAGNLMRSRYLFPAYPLLACAAGAVWVTRLDGSGARRWTGRIMAWLVYGFGFGAGPVLIGAGLWLQPRLAFGGGLLLLVTIAVWRLAAEAPRRSPTVGLLALFLVVSSLVVEGIVKPAFVTSPAPAFAAEIDRLAVTPRRVAVLGLRSKYAAQLRLLARDRIRVAALKGAVGRLELAAYDAAVFPAAYLPHWRFPEFRPQICGSYYRKVTPADLWRALKSGSREEILSVGREDCFIVMLPSPPLPGGRS